MSSFSGAVKIIIFFGQRWLSPLEKIGPHTCARKGQTDSIGL